MVRNLLNGWDIKKGVATPVLANLITAALLFSGAILFKEPIYDLMEPPKAEDFPLYMVAEPYTNAQGLLDVDLFVINLSGKRKTHSDLVNLLRSEASQQGRTVTPEIRLIWKTGLSGYITEISPYKQFNRGKGRIEIRKEKNGEWRITISEIGGKGILKLKVATSRKMGEIGRAAKISVPFKYIYPGE